MRTSAIGMCYWTVLLGWHYWTVLLDGVIGRCYWTGQFSAGHIPSDDIEISY